MLNFEGMRYEVKGSGKPILLLHGWGSSAKSFAQISTELALEYKVYAVDLWGFGISERPSESATIYDYAEVIYRFVERVIGEKTVLLGHSFGGRICLILGSRPLISGVVLVDSAGLRPRLSLRQKMRVRRYKKICKMVASGRKNAEVLSKFGSSDYRSLAPEMRGVFVRVINEDLEQCARDIDKPTLIIWGKRDRTTPPQMARKLHKLVVNSRLKWLAGGHFSYLDSPREFVRFCYEFLNSLEGRDV